MKLVEIIRLGIIAIALLLGYYFIINATELIATVPNMIDDSVGDSRGRTYMLLKTLAFFFASFLLIKYNRKIANYIEAQK